MSSPARKGGLQRTFVIALLIVGFVPGIVALVATYLYSTSSLKHSIGTTFQEIAHSTATQIAAVIDTEISRAVRLAAVPILIRQHVEIRNQRFQGKTQPEIRDLLTEEEKSWPLESALDAPRVQPIVRSRTTQFLKEWAEEANTYVRVVAADSRGAVVASTVPRVKYLNAETEWWQEAIRAQRGTAYVSTLRFDTDANTFVFDVAVPIMGEDGRRPIGVVALVIRREVLLNRILRIHVGETGHGMLLDSGGTPLVCPVLPPTAHLIKADLVERLTRNRPSWMVAEDDAHGGRNSIVGVAPVRFSHQLTPESLGGHRWFAFVRQDPAETYGPIYSLLLVVGLIGFGLVVVLSSLGMVVGRKIVSPILTLNQEADTLRRNIASLPDTMSTPPSEAMPASATIKTGDEIEDLAQTFYAMRTALEDNLRTIKLQQEELIRREKLASVGQLLAALAHDLKNPLGVIRSSAQLVLEREQPGEVKEEVARYIIEEVDRLTHRITDFLRYARQKPPEPRRIHPEALVQTALWHWRAQGGHDRIEVGTQFDEGVPELYVDPDQAKEALLNLLINAREAMPGGGRLTVAIRHGEGQSVDITVSDTGSGISPEDRARLFEPFFTTKEYGTGLGLTNVKRLVEDNGGTIRVESERGQGSCFILSLPIANHQDHRSEDRAEYEPKAHTSHH